MKILIDICLVLQACTQARTAIERHTSRLPPRALKVCVLLGPFLAHQGHALRLLHWLRKLMGICEGFRLLLADIVMKVISSLFILCRHEGCGG